MIYHLQQATQHAVVLREKIDAGSQGTNAYVEILSNDLASVSLSWQQWLEIERQQTKRILDGILKGEDADGNPF
jgi:hypothetical protein